MTTAAGGMPWSGEQREWLQALGHDVLLLASADAGVSQESGHPSDRGAPVVPPNPCAVAKPASPVPSLLRALARAAGRSEDDPEFLKLVPDLATLRSSAAARRALWPRLRALRKRGP